MGTRTSKAAFAAAVIAAFGALELAHAAGPEASLSTGPTDAANQRIAAAFAVIVVPEIRSGAPETRKTDRAPVNCVGQTWPGVTAGCLVPVGGAAVRPAVRTVTVEYRKGDNTSVLVRMPLAQMAAR